MRHKFIYLLVLLLGSCVEGPSGKTSDGFDRKAALTNWADNIITPAYQAFQSELTALEKATDTFVSSPTTTTFEQLQADWLTAYKAWQHIEMFNIGKAEEFYYHLKMNTYPCNKTIITNNIENQMHDLSAENASNYTAQGFPALDYLLYGLEGDILQKYQGDSSLIT